MMTTTIELFAGIAGFSSPHTQPVAFVEKEPTCRAVLRRHYPHALILDDVRTVGAHNLPWASVIKFGSPCQDFSIQTANREGINGNRSSLLLDAIRICDELRPDYAIWENVPGALTSNNGRDFAAVLRAFQHIGAHDIAWRVLDARFFGVAQRRRRLFLVADFRGERAAEILFEREADRGIAAQSSALHDNDPAWAIVDDSTPKIARGLFPTLRARASAGGITLYVAQPNQPARRTMPVEWERAQGFDDNWTAWGIDEQSRRVEMSDSTRYRMLGNAVNRRVSDWLDRQIVRSI